MELELGLKITKTRDDVSSSVDFRFSKDPFGPLVLSRETDSRFIIIIHLKGFKKEGIEIEINEAGNRITIRGRKPVEDMVLIRWMAWRKEVEFRVFKKVFLIPNIVDLDKIKARFDDDDSTLTITMPKSVKGISGYKIEEERVEFGDLSEVENREETENVEREKSDEEFEKFESESQREEEFGENNMEDKERERYVLGEDDNLEKTQHIDDFGSKTFNEIERQELDEIDGTTKKKMIDGDGSSKVQEIQEMVTGDISDQEKEKKDKKKMVMIHEEVNLKMGEGLAPNIAETEAKAEQFESAKPEANEIDELVTKNEEEKANIDGKGEETMLQEETEEQHSKGQKRHDKKEMVEENNTPEAETNIVNNTPKPVQVIEVPELNTLERCGGKHKIEKNFQEREDHKERILETGKKINDAGSRRVQGPEDEVAKCKKESKTNVAEIEEKEIQETETKEQESYRPKEQEEEEDKIQELVGEKTKFLRKEEEEEEEEEIAEKKTEIIDRRDGEDVEKEKKIETNKRIAREVQEIEKKDLDVSEKYGKEDKIQQVQEKEIKDEGDKPEKITDTIEQELVNNLNNQLKQENVEYGEKTQELVEKGTKDCKEEEAKTKTDDNVARKAHQGIKEHELYEPRREHVNKIKEVIKEKTDDHEKKDEKGMTELEEHKKRDKTRITRAEEPSGQEKEEEEEEEKIVEPVTTTKNDTSTDVQDSKEEGPEKRYKFQQVVEAGHNDLEEEKVIMKAEKENKSRDMKESEIVEKRTKTKDGSLRKVGDEEDPGLSKPYNKRQEVVKMGAREKFKNQDGNDILKSLEASRPDLDEERNIPQLVEGEKVEKTAEPKEKAEDNNSGKFHEFEEIKSYEDWIREEQEKRKNFVKVEATDPKDKHTGGEVHKEEHQEENGIAKEELKIEEGSSKMVQETEKQELDELQRSMVQDKIQETEENDKTRAIEENEIKKKIEDGKLGRQEESEEIENLFKEEATDDPKDKHTGEKEEEICEKVAQTKTKVEDEINKKAGKHQELDKMEGVLRERASDRKKGEENLMDDFASNIQETEKEEPREADRHKKLDIVQDFVEDKTRNQADEKPKEAAAVMANNEKELLMVHELKEPEEHKEQNKIFETSVPGVKEDDEERVAEKKVKEQEAHVQELEGETENFKNNNQEGRGERGKERKTVDTKRENRIVRKIQETKLQESNRKKDQEPEDKIEELDRKEPVKLVTEDDSFRQGQEFLEKESKRRLVEQEKFQELKEVKKQEDDEEPETETEIKEGNSRKSELLAMQGLDEPEESEERKKIQKPMEEKTNASEKVKVNEGNEKTAKEEMQEPIVEITKHHSEEMKRIAEDVKLGKVQKIKAQESDGSEKHHKPSEIQEKQNIQESVEETIPKHREEEEERSEGGRYNSALKEDSKQSQDVEEKGSDQEQEKIEEPFVEEERKKEYDIDKREKGEQKEPKANDDSSRKSEFEEQEQTRLREQKKRVKHQEMVEMETSDQSKEEKEDVRKGKTEAEYDRSRKIQDNKLEKLEETSNRKKGTERNRTVRGEEETKTRDDGCRKVKEIEEQELAVTHKEEEKNQELVKKDTAGRAKDKKDQETKNTDDSLRNVKEDEKQESKEQDKNMGLVPEKKNDCKNKESRKVDKEVANANGSRKLKKIEQMESNQVEKHENQDNIQEFGEDNMINQEEEDNESMMKEVGAKPKDDESERPVRLKEQDKTRKPVQFYQTNNRKDEEMTKESESSKKLENKEQETSEQIRLEEQETSEHMRLEEQERIQKLVEKDGNSKKIQEIEKEESTEPGRYEKRNKIQEPVLNMETSENEEEEELEVEFEESEEDWEAEVIQEMDSNGDNDEIRKIKRIKVGFQLVGGSALFMSLIVIVISIIRSKKNIKCYKF